MAVALVLQRARGRPRQAGGSTPRCPSATRSRSRCRPSSPGCVLILLFAVVFPVLPAGGTPPDGFLARPDISVQYLLLPAVCLALGAGAALTRFLTESLRTELRQPYVTTARALGISRRRIVLTQALRNALPVDGHRARHPGRHAARRCGAGRGDLHLARARRPDRGGDLRPRLPARAGAAAALGGGLRRHPAAHRRRPRVARPARPHRRARHERVPASTSRRRRPTSPGRPVRPASPAGHLAGAAARQGTGRADPGRRRSCCSGCWRRCSRRTARPSRSPAPTCSGPSGAHWLGTDEVNRDILSRTLYGIRIDLIVVFVAVPIGAADRRPGRADLELVDRSPTWSPSGSSTWCWRSRR